jgi:hypothetical protein
MILDCHPGDKIEGIATLAEGAPMKTLNARLMTTHVDLDNERMAVEGLESFAASVNNNHIPF